MNRLVVLGCAALLGACSKPKPTALVEVESLPDPALAPKVELVTRSYKTMGTQVTITARASDESVALKAYKDAFEEFDRLDAMMTVWRDTSDVARLNAAAGKAAVKVSPETMQVILRARKFSEVSGGKFDVTFGALSGLWKFDHDQDDNIPDPAEVKRRLQLIDYRQLTVDEKASTAKLEKAGMRAHLGGIGKGYAVDEAVAILRKAGLTDFMVQAGGDLYVSGTRGDRPWRVGIRDPRGPPQRYFAAAEVENGTFSTSGDYERFFLADGVRYHHIIDPMTGRPAQGPRSVTVMAQDALSADALSTSVFLMGPEAGMALIESIEGAGAVIVDKDNKVLISERLKGKIKILHAPSPGL